MDISLAVRGDEFATVRFTYGQDDYVDLGGYGDRGIKLVLSLRTPEARDLVEILLPIAGVPIDVLAANAQPADRATPPAAARAPRGIQRLLRPLARARRLAQRRRSADGHLAAQAAPGGCISQWEFYAPDSDHSTGWTNHGYVLQLVCEGTGATAEEAWQQAVAGGAVPSDYNLAQPPTVAIRTADIRGVDLSAVSGSQHPRPADRPGGDDGRLH